MRAGVRSTLLTKPRPSVGGIAIGAIGLGLYAGFVLGAGDEFRSLDLRTAATPNGKWLATRGYSNGGMHYPGSGPLAVQHNVDPFYTGPADRNRGVPIPSLADSHTIVAGDRGNVLRLKAIRQSDEELPLLATALPGQIERVAMISGAAYLWVNSPSIVEFRARMAAGRYGHHPSLWWLSATPPGGPTFSGNEYGWEGGRTEQEPYHNGWTSGSNAHSSGDKTNVYRDGRFHLYTIINTATQRLYYVDGVLYYTLNVDPDDYGNKPDYPLATNHIYDGLFESQTYDAADWTRLLVPYGVDVDLDFVRVWHPIDGAHYKPLTKIPDVFVSAGASLNLVLPPQSQLWGASGLPEYVTGVAVELEEPGSSSNAASIARFPAGMSYDDGTRTLSWPTIPAQPGSLLVAAGPTPDGSTVEVAAFRICVAPLFVGATSIAFTPGPVDIDVYPMWAAGRLLPMVLDVVSLPAGLVFNPATKRITGNYTSGSGTAVFSCTNSAGQTVTQNVTYAALSGVAAPTLTGSPVLLWSLDPGNDSTLTLTGAAIDSISGADGTPYTFTQTGSARPTLVMRDGKKAIRFTAGSAQFMDVASALGVASADGATLIAISEPATIAASHAILDIANPASAGGINRLMLSGGASGWSSRKASAAGNSDANLASSFTLKKRMLVSVFKPTTAGCSLYVDGTATPVNSSTGQAWPTGLARATLGARCIPAGHDLYGDEWHWRLLLYRGVLNATQIEEVSAWGNANFGTDNNA